MKRSTFIIIGFGIIVFLFGLWVYSLLYGTPKTIGEVFPDFGFGGNGTDVFPIPEEPILDETPIIDVVNAKLRQLTTRPVIGFYEQFSTTTEPRFVVYAEAGTGHIFSINMTTGEEIRLSNITIPVATMAAFSPTGEFAAIRSGYTNQNNIIVVDLREISSITSQTLPFPITDFNFDSNGNLLFTEETGLGTIGKKISLPATDRSEIFTVPFLSATVRWSEAGNTPHYVYPKASARLLGYLYELNAGSLRRTPIEGSGLIAKAGRDFIFYTHLINTENRSFVYDLITKKTTSAPIILTPEKCSFSNVSSSVLYCGYEITEYSYDYPDNWYKGARAFNDRIWRVDLNFQAASQLINPVQAVGRSIDITNMKTSVEDTAVYFTNKNDKTLWVYEL